jgi:hypothetical protein
VDKKYKKNIKKRRTKKINKDEKKRLTKRFFCHSLYCGFYTDCEFWAGFKAYQATNAIIHVFCHDHSFLTFPLKRGVSKDEDSLGAYLKTCPALCAGASINAHCEGRHFVSRNFFLIVFRANITFRHFA